MKKIICVILCAFTLLACASCNSIAPIPTETTTAGSNVENNTPTENPTNTAHSHDVVNGSCSVCGLNYYDELKSLILTHGTNNGRNIIRVESIHEYAGDNYMVWLVYEQENDNLYFRCFPEKTYPFEEFIIYLDKVSIKKQKYNWSFDRSKHEYSDGGEISGKLDATEFAESTSALEYENSTFASDSNASKHAKRSAQILEIILENEFIPLLEKSTHEISPAHFGFDYFE